MKTVFISGGSRGIGAAMVRAFAAAGYKVAFSYKSSEDAARALSSETGAMAICADSACEEEIAEAIKITEKTLGNIEILINNAAVWSSSLITDVSTEEWKNMFCVNVDAPFIYSKCVLPSMIRAGWGRIINISSMWGLVGSSCEVCYSATKAALIGFTKALAKEVGPSGITVNAIAPGLIDTDMNASLSQEDKKAFINEVPTMRIGRAEEIAEIALFLSSDGAAYITGDVINASGGAVI
jgi:3-oxoacyl-[acyl-carrier protein] reductase